MSRMLKSKKKRASSIYGYDGNDYLVGSKKDDILDGGDGNDILNGKKGSDIYILSSGKDKIKGFSVEEGDIVQVESSIEIELVSSKNHVKILHSSGVTKVFNILISDLENSIQIV